MTRSKHANETQDELRTDIFNDFFYSFELQDPTADLDDDQTFWWWFEDLQKGLIEHAQEKGIASTIAESFIRDLGLDEDEENPSDSMIDAFGSIPRRCLLNDELDFLQVIEETKKLVLKYIEFSGGIIDPNYSNVDPYQEYGIDPSAGVGSLIGAYVAEHFKEFEELTQEEFHTPKPQITNPIKVAIERLKEQGFYDLHAIPPIKKLRDEFKGKRLDDVTYKDVYQRIFNDYSGLEETIYEYNEIDRMRTMMHDNPHAIPPKPDAKWTTWRFVFNPTIAEVMKAIKRSFKHIIVLTDSNTQAMDDLYYYDQTDGFYHPLNDGLLSTLAKTYHPKFTMGDLKRLKAEMMVSGEFKHRTMEKDPLLSPFKNGVFNARTGRLEKHSPERVFIGGHGVDYTWDTSQAECGFMIDAFILQMAGGDPVRASYIWRMIGEALFPNYQSKKAWFLLGNGTDGKSTLMEMLGTIVGTRTASATLEELSDAKRDNFLSGTLYSAWLIIGDDNRVEQKVKGVSFIKTLIRGGMTNIRIMQTQPFMGKIRATMIQSGNSLPEIEGLDKAFLDRFNFVKTFNLFKQHSKMPTGFKKLSDDELRQSLDFEKNPSLYRYLASEAVRRFDPAEELEPLNDTINMIKDMVEDQSIETLFIEEYFTGMPAGRYPRSLVYQAYEKFCLSENELPKKGQIFLKAMEKAVPMSKFKDQLDVRGGRDNKMKFDANKHDEFFEDLKTLNKLPNDFERKTDRYIEFTPDLFDQDGSES